MKFYCEVEFYLSEVPRILSYQGLSYQMSTLVGESLVEKFLISQIG